MNILVIGDLVGKVGVEMFSKNISPKISSLSAVAVGYLLLDDLSASEQNALGNWLMLVAQVLSTNAYFKQLQSEYQNEKSNNYKMASEVDILKRMKDALEKEINNLEK